MKTATFLVASLLACGGPWVSDVALSASYEYCARAPEPRACRAKAEANDERRRKQDEEIRMRNTPHQTKQAIERTIEGFTLGMSLSDASRLLTAGIQKGQFKVVRERAFSTITELPIISDFDSPSLDKTITVKQSTVFSTEAAKGIQLFFYESKLYWIAMSPYSPHLLKALTEKYGPPFRSSSRWCFDLGSSGDAWTDGRTTINYCAGPGGLGVSPVSGLWFALNVNYLDQQLISQMENYERQTRQKQEEEKRRKSQTLPKNY